MTEKDIRERLRELPKGSLGTEEMNGRTYHYLQGSENGRKFTRYVKKADLPLVMRGLEEGREPEERLDDSSWALPTGSVRRLPELGMTGFSDL